MPLQKQKPREPNDHAAKYRATDEDMKSFQAAADRLRYYSRSEWIRSALTEATAGLARFDAASSTPPMGSREISVTRTLFRQIDACARRSKTTRSQVIRAALLSLTRVV